MAENPNSNDEVLPVPTMGLKGRTWLFIIVGLLVVGMGILYLFEAAKGAMLEAPDPTRTVEQVYLQRCGSCHTAPPAKEYANWARDWDRNAERTMWMGNEREEVHHYLESLRPEN